MGKSRKQRTVRRHNPVRVPESHLPRGLEAAEATSSKRDAVLPIIQKLESPHAEDRTWASAAISVLIENDPSTRRLLQGKNIVGMLVTRLSDSTDEVVFEAAGALRNLCIDGGYEICAEMYNKNILAPLKEAVSKISRAMHELLTSSPKARKDTKQPNNPLFGFAENVITILWCLSETSNKALNAINKLTLSPFLFGFLDNRLNLQVKTVVAAAQCLYVLTDENEDIIEEIRSDSHYTSTLLDIAGSNGSAPETLEDMQMTLQVLAAGILKNISPIPAPSTASTIDIDRTVVLPLLIPVIQSITLPEASNEILTILSHQNGSSVEQQGNPSPHMKNIPKADHRTKEELELEGIERRLRTVQLALEILTGICATLPDPYPGVVPEEEGEDGDDEGDDDAPMQDDGMELDLTQNPSETPSSVSSPNTNTYLLPTILSPLLALIQPTSLSFPLLTSTTTTTSTPTHLPTTSALSSIHLRALECLNNIFLSIAVSSSASSSPSVQLTAGKDLDVMEDVQTGMKVWDAIWIALGLVGIEVGGRGQEKRKEMWEVSVGVLWGIGSIWKGKLVPDATQVAVLMQLCDSSTDDEVKIKCIGTLECLAYHTGSVEANKVISQYLLSLLPVSASSNPSSQQPSSSATFPGSIIQATSALIDIFSDETLPYDINFRNCGFLQALVDNVAGVKKVVKSIDRRREGGREMRMKGEEVLANLVAFVEYRKGL